MIERAHADEPFALAAQQRRAGRMGMHLFLATETMLFGGLLALLLAYRVLHPAEIVEASHRLHLWLGTLNTGLLLTSSLTVAVAVHAARAERRRVAAAALAGAILLGLAFLAVKGLEYRIEYAEGLLPPWSREGNNPARLFMDLYLVATGLHAIHLTIGIGLLTGLFGRTIGRSVGPRLQTVETIGLYWHFVDLVWVFLYPILYLAR